MTIKLNKANLAVHRLASKDNSRYTINGILLSPEGTVATDGHVLGIVQLPEQEPETNIESKIIGTDTCKDAERIAKNSHVTLNGDNTLRSPATGTSLEFTPIDGRFPNWQAVMPTVERLGFKICVNPAKLRQIADFLERAMGDNCEEQGCLISFQAGDDKGERAIRFDAVTESGQPVSALLMPIQGKVEPHDWTTKEEK